MKTVLDPCCSARAMWFDKADPRAVFGDIRSETLTVADRSHRHDGTRTLRIEPDALMDFRALPFPDASFALVAFDPPHLVRAGPKSWMAARYGKLSDNWREKEGMTIKDDPQFREDLRKMMAEQRGKSGPVPHA